MIIEGKKTGPIEIDLNGPQGNAYVLLGLAEKLAKQLNKNGKAITEKMTSGDYDNLINVFDNEFGDYCVLYK